MHYTTSQESGITVVDRVRLFIQVLRHVHESLGNMTQEYYLLLTEEMFMITQLLNCKRNTYKYINVCMLPSRVRTRTFTIDFKTEPRNRLFVFLYYK